MFKGTSFQPGLYCVNATLLEYGPCEWPFELPNSGSGKSHCFIPRRRGQASLDRMADS